MSISAVRLSLDESIECTTSRSGGDDTDGDLGGVAGARAGAGRPTCTPRARSRSVSSAAALRVGSSTGTFRAGDQVLNPSFDGEGAQRPTSPSVR